MHHAAVITGTQILPQICCFCGPGLSRCASRSCHHNSQDREPEGRSGISASAFKIARKFKAKTNTKVDWFPECLRLNRPLSGCHSLESQIARRSCTLSNPVSWANLLERLARTSRLWLSHVDEGHCRARCTMKIHHARVEDIDLLGENRGRAYPSSGTGYALG